MVSTGSTCGDNATSYYYEFEYEDQRVVIVNGIPDHDAENDQLVDNTNTRCERWQFMTVPIDPSKGTDATETSMGVVALAVTGKEDLHRKHDFSVILLIQTTSAGMK